MNAICRLSEFLIDSHLGLKTNFLRKIIFLRKQTFSFLLLNLRKDSTYFEYKRLSPTFIFFRIIIKEKFGNRKLLRHLHRILNSNEKKVSQLMKCGHEAATLPLRSRLNSKNTCPPLKQFICKQNAGRYSLKINVCSKSF